MSPLARTVWRGVAADVVENDELRVVVLPERGARIASLSVKRSGREWLQPPRATMLTDPPPFGAVYTDTDHFGWDEMFPTVDPCVVADHCGGEVALVDHGEVWNRAWTYVGGEGEVLVHAIESDVFPARLVRRLRLCSRTLHLEYALSSSSDIGFGFLWAAHPQFVCAGGTTISIEPPPESVIDVTAGDVAVERSWRGPLRIEDDLAPGSDRMIYVPPGAQARAVRLEAPGGAWLRVSWDGAALPYLGIWLDRGRRTTGQVVAVEPTTAYYDSLARAGRLGRVGVLAPGETRRWWLTAEVGERGETWTSS